MLRRAVATGFHEFAEPAEQLLSSLRTGNP
jgi:hypothetical protein